MENSPSFAALLHEVRGEPVLKVSGELDLHSAPRFKDTLEKAVASAECAGSRIPLLVVDLSETGFMDSMGLGTLIGSTQKIREGGGEVRLAVSGGEVLRVLEETGLDDALYRLPRRTVGCRRSNEAETVCDGPCTAHAFAADSLTQSWCLICGRELDPTPGVRSGYGGVTQRFA